MTGDTDWDDPRNVIAWQVQARRQVVEYLEREGIHDSRLRMEPEYAAPPYVSLWYSHPEHWVIYGDLPTDYVLAGASAQIPDVLGMFATRWERASENMIAGRPDPEIQIGDQDDAGQQEELGQLLGRRAFLLRKIAVEEFDAAH